MLFLSYIRNGFSKAYPLKKNIIRIGRGGHNDLQINEVYVSKSHAELTVYESSVKVVDMNSTNGIYSEDKKVKEIIINLNDCFKIGEIKFFLKKGIRNDFSLSRKIIKFPLQLSKSFDGGKTVKVDNPNLLYHDEDLSLKIVSNNQKIKNLMAQSKKIAKSKLFVLITGETGVGKELLAKFIHINSTADKDKYIALNCSAIPENLMEAELFGYEKGAFTDAKEMRKGKFELASGGTLILDEIGDMPLSLQVKLLRVIQEEQFYRLGGTVPIKVKLRIISITNKGLFDLVKQKIFRDDLYYRIAHIIFEIPPLKDRKEDIILLINHFIQKYSSQIDSYIKGFTEEIIKALEFYNWPGNIRELENEIIKLLNLAEHDDIIDYNMLKDDIKLFYKDNKTFKGYDEKQLILNLLKANKWNKTVVANKMRISRTSLYNKLKKYNL